jgi:Dolichyl-phosphate-mannose-protein mannosyltransferase
MSHHRTWVRTLGILLLFALALYFRYQLTLHRKLNADELQHLHAAWMVSQGLTPYLDFWENHTPLLYYIAAPVLAASHQEIASILFLRAILSVAGIGILLLVYWIARASQRDRFTSLVAALLLAYSSIFMQKTIEFRPDQPLVICWLLGLWFVIRSSTENKQWWFLGGLFVGTGMLFTPKALMCYAALVLFIIAMRLPLRTLLKRIILCSTGFIIPILVLALFFYPQEALAPLIQLTLLDNFHYPDLRRPSFLLSIPNLSFLLLGFAGMILSFRKNKNEILLVPALFLFVSLVFLLPSTFSQSALTFLPLFAIYGAVTFKEVREPKPKVVLILFVVLAAVIIPFVSLLLTNPLRATNREQFELISFLVNHIGPEERVFDGNAAYIFRRQAYFYGSLVQGVRYRIKNGTIAERIPESLIKNQCKLLIFDDRVSDLPQEIQNFIRLNYLALNKMDIFVAGKELAAENFSGNSATFRIEIPASYKIDISPSQTFEIDDRLYTSPLQLNRGVHRIRGAQDLKRVRVSASLNSM